MNLNDIFKLPSAHGTNTFLFYWHWLTKKWNVKNYSIYAFRQNIQKTEKNDFKRSMLFFVSTNTRYINIMRYEEYKALNLQMENPVIPFEFTFFISAREISCLA